MAQTISERGLLVAIERSHRLNKTPPLVSIRLRTNWSTTCYSYQAPIIVEAKRDGASDVATKRQEHAAVMEGLRQQLVNFDEIWAGLFTSASPTARAILSTASHRTTPFHSPCLTTRLIASLANSPGGHANESMGL